MKIDANELRLLGEELVNSVAGTQIGPRLKSILFNSNGLLTTQSAHSFGQSLLSLCNAYDEQEKEIERLRDALGFYANEDFHNNGFEVSTIEIDNGDLARRTLEGK